MRLIKNHFLAQNGQEIEYFQTNRGIDTKAHVFWFSAFTHGPFLGKILKTEQRFHGFKAASSFSEFDFTMLRDGSGLTSDGTYYYGKSNDPFIEIAMNEFIHKEISRIREIDPNKKIIGIGSSMGAYGAAKFGILNSFDAVLALVPHFDLNLARTHCGRKNWIDWACQGGSDFENYQYLNRLQIIVHEHPNELPKLFAQSALDDVGVHDEQVIPFRNLYMHNGGIFIEDFHARGGHSMVNASNEYIRAVLNLLAESSHFEKGMFDSFPKRVKSNTEKMEDLFARIENGAATLLRRFHIIS